MMNYLISLRVCFMYGFIFFCTSLIHNIFLVYHVQAFVSCYSLSKPSFWFAEFIFLCWNAINDPLFGWLIDKKLLQEKVSTHSRSDAIARKRAWMISRVGPFFSLAFLSMWFSCWLPYYPGCRFAIALCTYDTMTTIIDLQKGALLADLAVTQVDRSRLGSAASVGQMLSASGLVLITWLVGSIDQLDISGGVRVKEVPFNFQSLAFILAVFSAIGLWFCGHWLAHTPVLLSGSQPIEDPELMTKGNDGNLVSEPILQKQDLDSQNVFSFMEGVLRQPNFLTFSLMQALQVFHCHFNSNFFPLFAKTLLGPDSEALFCLILGVSFVLPHLNNVFLLKACESYGSHFVIRCLFLLKILLGCFLYLSGRYNRLLLSIFLASNRMFTEGVCKLLSQVISDLVDEDFVINHRGQPLSALIFGASSLLGRPGQTFAPLLGYWLLSILTGHEILASTDAVHGFNTSDVSSINNILDLPDACFTLAWSLVFVVGLLQLLIWSQYKLHGAYLLRIKLERLARMVARTSA